jgi:hypothetical protein
MDNFDSMMEENRALKFNLQEFMKIKQWLTCILQVDPSNVQTKIYVLSQNQSHGNVKIVYTISPE